MTSNVLPFRQPSGLTYLLRRTKRTLRRKWKRTAACWSDRYAMKEAKLRRRGFTTNQQGWFGKESKGGKFKLVWWRYLEWGFARYPEDWTVSFGHWYVRIKR